MDEVFYQMHRGLPRHAPGSVTTTQLAIDRACQHITKPITHVMDIGCGVGTQTVQLAERFPQATVIAVDVNDEFLDLLRRTCKEKGITNIRPTNRSMLDLQSSVIQENGEFDIIWAEGSIYIIGFEKGLTEWKHWVRSGGVIAITELSWICTSKDDLPQEVLMFWEKEYPAMKTVQENIDVIKSIPNVKFCNHFVLPESDWWEYYGPLQKNIELLKNAHLDSPSLVSGQEEINLYRKYCKFYGYVFYIIQVL